MMRFGQTSRDFPNISSRAIRYLIINTLMPTFKYLKFRSNPFFAHLNSAQINSALVHFDQSQSPHVAPSVAKYIVQFTYLVSNSYNLCAFLKGMFEWLEIKRNFPLRFELKFLLIGRSLKKMFRIRNPWLELIEFLHSDFWP